jgi:tetratricopeptide (TPR) repeat protein
MPGYPQALANLGAVYGRMGKFEAALELFIKTLERTPDDPITLFNLGLVCEELVKSYEPGTKSYELKTKAVEAYRKVLTIDPGNAQAMDRMTRLTGEGDE